MNRLMIRRSLAVSGIAAVVVALSTAAAGSASAAGTAPTIPLQLLAVNDLHGNLEPVGGASGAVTTAVDPVTGVATTVPAGGVANLATHLQQARVGHPNSLTISAGDMIGGSPLLSAAFHDEPTVLALQAAGLAVSSVGNHEFDEGKTELKRINNGGCRPDDGCYDVANPYTGAHFYLAANVIDTGTHLPLLPPVTVKIVNGAVIGFIGMTLEDTPSVVSASGVAGLTFRDEVDTGNRYAKLLRAIDVNAIVVLIHQGGEPASPVYNYNCDAGGPGAGLDGPIIDIARNLDPSIDLIVSAHTHESYVCTLPDPAGQPRLVTQAASFGRLFTDIEMTYDKHTRDIVRPSVSAHNVINTLDVTPDPTVQAIINKYKALIGPLANRPVGYIATTILGRGGTTPERPLGDVITDAQHAATSSATTGAADIAITNVGGLRADLVYPQSGVEGNGVVTYGEAFAVQPFNGLMVTESLTGTQLVTALHQQFTGTNAGSPRYLQISSGLHWSEQLGATGAARVITNSITINGAALIPSSTYRVTMNDFLAGGGDGFTVLASGTNRLIGDLDITVFTNYLTANSSSTTPLAPPALNRITFVPAP
jgi:5'-nucleotidase